jgi:hypothetical protein
VPEGAQFGAGAEATEEGVELGQVHAVVLRIDVPDEGLAGPLRAHERVFAAHEVQVGAPEQVVVVALREHGQFDGTQRAVAQRRAEPRGDLSSRVTRGREQQRGAVCEPLEQGGQSALFVAEQADDLLAGLRGRALRGEPGVRIEAALAREQIGFADQAAGVRGEARVEKQLAQSGARAARLRRAQRVRSRDEIFGAEVFKVDPQRRRRHGRHAPHERVGQVATEGFDHDVAGRDLDPVVRPGAQLDTRRTARRHPAQGRGVVDPQSHRLPARAEVGGEPPAHADVAEVVDHAAEDVPLHRPHYPNCRGTIMAR